MVPVYFRLCNNYLAFVRNFQQACHCLIEYYLFLVLHCPSWGNFACQHMTKLLVQIDDGRSMILPQLVDVLDPEFFPHVLDQLRVYYLYLLDFDLCWFLWSFLDFHDPCWSSSRPLQPDFQSHLTLLGLQRFLLLWLSPLESLVCGRTTPCRLCPRQRCSWQL